MLCINRRRHYCAVYVVLLPTIQVRTFLNYFLRLIYYLQFCCLGEDCLPARCVQLSTFQMICYKHAIKPRKKADEEKKGKTGSKIHFNVNYCTACSDGGDLICCERCPTSVHCDCVGLDKEPEGSYLCPDCTLGKSVLFGDIVWVKIGHYRFEIHIGIRRSELTYQFVSSWWPGQVLPLDEIPSRRQKYQPKPEKFLVYFYGSNDSAFVYRGQVFHYKDGVSYFIFPTLNNIHSY